MTENFDKSLMGSQEDVRIQEQEPVLDLDEKFLIFERYKTLSLLTENKKTPRIRENIALKKLEPEYNKLKTNELEIAVFDLAYRIKYGREYIIQQFAGLSRVFSEEELSPFLTLFDEYKQFENALNIYSKKGYIFASQCIGNLRSLDYYIRGIRMTRELREEHSLADGN